MKAFAITTLGCKVNQYEGQQIRQLLEQLGLTQVQTTEKPELVVINTCCVTGSASAKSRQYIRRAQKLSRDAVIVVCGCLPTVEIGELGYLGKNIRFIRQRESTAAILAEIVNGEGGGAGSGKLRSDQYVRRAKNGPKVRLNNDLCSPAKLAKPTSCKGHTGAFQPGSRKLHSNQYFRRAKNGPKVRLNNKLRNPSKVAEIVNGEAMGPNLGNTQTEQYVKRAHHTSKMRPNNELRDPAKLPQLTSFNGEARGPNLGSTQTDQYVKRAENGSKVGLDNDLCTPAKLAQLTSFKGHAGAFQPNFRNIQSDQYFRRAKNGPKVRLNNDLRNPAKLPQLTSFKGHTRAFLKVQDGCDGYCSYCIIPQARPNVHSKAGGAVLQEAEALVKAGHKEIVVTGVFLGAYGQDSVRRKTWANEQNDKLADLLDEMARIPGLARIRLSSLEPGDVTERLVDSLCRHRNIMPHLHLSLQSGSDAVLRRMGRQYSVCKFLRAVDLAKSRLDRPAITADVIVGFPGEREGDFEATVGLAREVGFAKMHVFGFSARPGTAAAEMQGVVNNRVIKRRSEVLRDLDAELGRRFREGFVGEESEILLENGGLKGRSERYFMVFVRKTGIKKLRPGELVRVRLVENREDGVVGES